MEGEKDGRMEGLRDKKERNPYGLDSFTNYNKQQLFFMSNLIY